MINYLGIGVLLPGEPEEGFNNVCYQLGAQGEIYVDHVRMSGSAGQLLVFPDGGVYVCGKTVPDWWKLVAGKWTPFPKLSLAALAALLGRWIIDGPFAPPVVKFDTPDPRVQLLMLPIPAETMAAGNTLDLNHGIYNPQAVPLTFAVDERSTPLDGVLTLDPTGILTRVADGPRNPIPSGVLIAVSAA